MKRWLFVVGPGRTGTSLVAWLLSQHPDCRIMSDTRIAWWTTLVYTPALVDGATRVAFSTTRALEAGE